MSVFQTLQLTFTVIRAMWNLWMMQNARRQGDISFGLSVTSVKEKSVKSLVTGELNSLYTYSRWVKNIDIYIILKYQNYYYRNLKYRLIMNMWSYLHTI